MLPSPLPVRVANSRAGVEVLTTLSPLLTGTQMFEPSKTGIARRSNRSHGEGFKDRAVGGIDPVQRIISFINDPQMRTIKDDA